MNLNGCRVVEFGSSYGGLAWVLFATFPKIKMYHMIDLPIVQELSKKYLTKLGLDMSKVSYELPIDPPDYLISEYALSEQSPDVIYPLLNRLMPKHLFLRENFWEFKMQKDFEMWLRDNKYEILVMEGEKPDYRKSNRIIIARLTSS